MKGVIMHENQWWWGRSYTFIANDGKAMIELAIDETDGKDYFGTIQSLLVHESARHSGRGRHDACRLPMARLQARMYDHGCHYTYDVPHGRWRMPFYDSAHGHTLSNPHRATNRWRATD